MQLESMSFQQQARQVQARSLGAIIHGLLQVEELLWATSTDNQVVTVTGADAITGETNLIYNGTILGAGADGANADLGVGLHIKTADSGAGVFSWSR